MSKIKELTYFQKLGKEKTIALLAEEERRGRLFHFVYSVAPEYIKNARVDNDKIWADLNIDDSDFNGKGE